MRPAFSIVGRIQSIGHAVAGVAYMVRTQHSAWFHIVVAALVFGLSGFARISAADWRWILMAIFLIWVAEALNTAIEVLCDLVSPSYSLAIKRVKDVGAGAVLLAFSCAAAIVVLTLRPYWLG